MIYSIGARTLQSVDGTPACEFRSTSANKPRIMEIGFTYTNTATGTPVMGLGRPAAIGTNPTSTSALDETDGNAGNGLVTIATGWTTQPTVPTNFLRRVTTNQSVGTGYMWTFPRGLAIPISSSIVIWSIVSPTPGVLDVWAAVDE